MIKPEDLDSKVNEFNTKLTNGSIDLKKRDKNEPKDEWKTSRAEDMKKDEDKSSSTSKPGSAQANFAGIADNATEQSQAQLIIPDDTDGAKPTQIVPMGNSQAPAAATVFTVDSPTEDQAKLMSSFVGPRHAYEGLQQDYLSKILPLQGKAFKIQVKPYGAGQDPKFADVVPGGVDAKAEQEIVGKEVSYCRLDAWNDQRVVVKCVEKYGDTMIKTLRIYGSNIQNFEFKKEIVLEASKKMHQSYHKIHILQHKQYIYYFKRMAGGAKSNDAEIDKMSDEVEGKTCSLNLCKLDLVTLKESATDMKMNENEEEYQTIFANQMSPLYVMYIKTKDDIERKIFHDLKTAMIHQKVIKSDRDNVRGILIVDAINQKVQFRDKAARNLNMQFLEKKANEDNNLKINFVDNSEEEFLQRQFVLLQPYNYKEDYTSYLTVVKKLTEVGGPGCFKVHTTEKVFPLFSISVLTQLLVYPVKGKQYPVPVAGDIPDATKEALTKKLTFMALNGKSNMIDYYPLQEDLNDFNVAEDKADPEKEVELLDDEHVDLEEFQMTQGEIEALKELQKDWNPVRFYENDNQFNQECTQDVQSIDIKIRLPGQLEEGSFKQFFLVSGSPYIKIHALYPRFQEVNNVDATTEEEQASEKKSTIQKEIISQIKDGIGYVNTTQKVITKSTVDPNNLKYIRSNLNQVITTLFNPKSGETIEGQSSLGLDELGNCSFFVNGFRGKEINVYWFKSGNEYVAKIQKTTEIDNTTLVNEGQTADYFQSNYICDLQEFILKAVTDKEIGKETTFYLHSTYQNVMSTNHRVLSYTKKGEIETHIQTDKDVVLVEMSDGSFKGIKIMDDKLKEEDLDIKIVQQIPTKVQYNFILQYSNIYFFVTVPVSQIGNQPLVSDNTMVYIINVEEPDPNQDALTRLKSFNMNQCLFSELRVDQTITNKQANIQLVTERFVDEKDLSSGYPLIYVEKRALGNQQNLTVIVLKIDVPKPVIMRHECVNPSMNDLRNLNINNGLEICRSSNRFTSNDGESIVKFTIAYKLDQQGGRIVTREFSYIFSNFMKGGELKLSGGREILSSNLEEVHNRPVSISLIPLYSDYGKTLKGCQLLKLLSKTGMIVFNLFDSLFCVPMQLKYEEAATKSSYQKLVVRSGTVGEFQSDKDQFYIITNVQVRLKYISNDFLHRSDLNTLMLRKNFTFLKMIPFEFDRYVLKEIKSADFERIFLEPQEVLLGKSCADLYFKKPSHLREHLARTVEYYQNNQDNYNVGSLAEILIDGIQERADDLVKSQLYFGCPQITADFNCINQLKRASSMNLPTAVEILIDFMQEDYGHEFISVVNYRLAMGSLPDIFRQEYISSDFMEKFFNQGADGSTMQTKMERPMNFKELPEFSPNQEETYRVHNFYDDSNYIKEMVGKISSKVQQNVFGEDVLGEAEDDIINSGKAKVQGTLESKTFQRLQSLSLKEEKPASMYSVLYSFMSFRSLIFQMRIQSIIDNPENPEFIVFDDLFLARMISEVPQNEDNIKLYSQKSIQKVIDYQFAISSVYYNIIFGLYLLFMFWPLIMMQFMYQDQFLQYQVAFCHSMLVMGCIMFLTEIIQLIASPMAYIRGGSFYNIADWLRFGMVIAYFVERKSNGFSLKNGGTYNQIILYWFVLVLVFVKCIFYARIYAKLGFLVQMVVFCLYEVWPFLLFLISFVVTFAGLEKNLQITWESTAPTPLLESSISYGYQMWMNAVGMNTAVPDYSTFWNSTSYAKTEMNTKRTFAVWIIWITWVFYQYLCVVLLLNFLVSYVGEIYGRVTAAQASYSYRQKAELNSEFYAILAFFRSNIPFKVMGFSISKSLVQKQDEQQPSLHDQVIHTIKSQVGPLQKEMKDMRSMMEAMMVELQTAKGDK